MSLHPDLYEGPHGPVDINTSTARVFSRSSASTMVLVVPLQVTYPDNITRTIPAPVALSKVAEYFRALAPLSDEQWQRSLDTNDTFDEASAVVERIMQAVATEYDTKTLSCYRSNEEPHEVAQLAAASMQEMHWEVSGAPHLLQWVRTDPASGSLPSLRRCAQLPATIVFDEEDELCAPQDPLAVEFDGTGQPRFTLDPNIRTGRGSDAISKMLEGARLATIITRIDNMLSEERNTFAIAESGTIPPATQCKVVDIYQSHLVHSGLVYASVVHCPPGSDITIPLLPRHTDVREAGLYAMESILSTQDEGGKIEQVKAIRRSVARQLANDAKLARKPAALSLPQWADVVGSTMLHAPCGIADELEGIGEVEVEHDAVVTLWDCSDTDLPTMVFSEDGPSDHGAVDCGNDIDAATHIEAWTRIWPKGADPNQYKNHVKAVTFTEIIQGRDADSGSEVGG